MRSTRPMCILHNVLRDKERNVIVIRLYEAMSKEFYSEKEYPTTMTLAGIAQNAFKDPILRSRLINWRGLGNENELWIAQDENNLKEVQWFEDGMTLLNGATITSRLSFRDRWTVHQEERNSYRNRLFGSSTDSH